ncbi:MAG: glycosyltransferase family A protein [bacterium]
MPTNPWPSDALAATDIRTCDARAEIERCRGILAWLDAIPADELLRTTPPPLDADLISVVVPMYNARRWIDACLKGLLAQTHVNQEIFCVDDASEDDTYTHLVERFGADKRICAIRLGATVGPYQIKNWVIGSLARGHWIALQDADDVSHPLRLQAQCEWMRATGQRVSGTCAHQFFPAGISHPLGRGGAVEHGGVRHNLAFFPSLEPTFDRSPHDARPEQRAGTEFWPACRSGPYKVYQRVLADHGTQMMQRSLVLEFGGFDGRTRVAGDSDFNARVIRFHAIGNLPTVLYSRRFHADSLTQHPATDLASAQRQDYRARRALGETAIDAALAEGNVDRARELCTADLYSGDVVVREMRSGFPIAEPACR